MNKKQLGAEGEQFVCSQLQHQKFFIVEMNWRCRYGEIDIVAKKGQLLYFIEVRTRSVQHGKQPQFGYAIEAINFTKIKKLHQLAQLYCYSKHYKQYEYRLLYAPVSYCKEKHIFRLDDLISI